MKSTVLVACAAALLASVSAASLAHAQSASPNQQQDYQAQQEQYRIAQAQFAARSADYRAKTRLLCEHQRDIYDARYGYRRPSPATILSTPASTMIATARPWRTAISVGRWPTKVRTARSGWPGNRPARAERWVVTVGGQPTKRRPRR